MDNEQETPNCYWKAFTPFAFCSYPPHLLRYLSKTSIYIQLHEIRPQEFSVVGEGGGKTDLNSLWRLLAQVT